jgi:hypothetical protein
VHRKLLRVVAALVLATGSVALAAPTSAAAAHPPIKHVWTIVLENSDLVETLGTDVTLGSSYLARTLAPMGAFVPNYFGTGHSSLDNYIAMVGGQGPTPQTQGDCSDDAVVGGDYEHSRFDVDGQALGTPAAIAAGQAGCVYAADVPTLSTQLTEHGKTWRTYAEDVDGSPATLRSTCQAARWASRTNAAPGAQPVAFNDYKRKHDPLVYFHSVTGLEPGSGAPSAEYDANEVGLGRLPQDLASIATTPNWSFIVPNQCNDGHDSPCRDGRPGGVQQADEFLRTWVPRITGSPAFADGGLLIVTFDEGSEALACCNEVTSPNLPPNKDNGFAAPPSALTKGGGQVGAFLVSPYITPGTVSPLSYNHFSYLRSMEDLFDLGPTAFAPGSDGAGHLGYAGRQGGSTANAPTSFGADVFTNPDGPTPVVPEVPYALLVPLAAAVVLGFVLLRRTRRAPHANAASGSSVAHGASGTTGAGAVGR